MYNAVDVLMRVALATEGASEVPANTNRGPFVERCQRITGNKAGDPWCASWLAMVGTAAVGESWPLPKTGGCQALADFAKAKGVLKDTPQDGDAFLVWHESLHRFGHTGLVLDATTRDTISGNTSGAGSREGWIVGRRIWTFTPADRFIRWTALL